MSDKGITLNSLFGLPNEDFSRKALSAGMDAEETSSLKQKAMSAIPGLLWGSVESDILQGISEVLNMDLMEVLSEAWKQHGALSDYAEQSKSSGAVHLVELVDHSMGVELHPFVEIELAGFSKKIILDVMLVLTLKALRLKIEDARIKSVETGSCEGRGEIRIKGFTLLDLPFKPIDLPGKISLGNGNPV